MTIPNLPAQGDTAWYDWATGLDTEARKVVDKLDTSAASATYAARAAGTTAEAEPLPFVNVRDFGAVGDGITDDTAAIQAAIDAVGFGGTVLFPGVASSAVNYQITARLEVTQRNVRLLGPTRDVYGANIGSTSLTSGPLLRVKAASCVIENLGFVGNGEGGGLGATTTGVEVWGDSDGNNDCDFRGATFQYLAVGVMLRGRNSRIDPNCMFTSCLYGVVNDTIDAGWHVGASASQNRGHVIEGRFHDIGVDATTAAIEIRPGAKMLHGIITPKHIDSNGKGRHIVVRGDAANPAKGVTVRGVKHTETAADAITFEYVQNSVIDSPHIMGNTAATTYGNGIVLSDCNNIDVLTPTMLQVGKHGIKITACTEVRLRQPSIKITGLDTSTTYDGINIDATSTIVSIEDPDVQSATGYAINGSPTGSRLRGGRFASNELGNINSTTLWNTVSSGLSTYAESTLGRGEERARKNFDLAAGVATQVAVVTGGGNFASFFVRVRFSARAGGSCYVAAERAVFTENGTPVFATVGTDATALCTVAFATNSATSIKITLTATNAASGTVMVETYGAGASNTTNPRSAQITMS